MKRKDVDCLIRADRTTANYQKRIAALQAEVKSDTGLLQRSDVKSVISALHRAVRVQKLQAEAEAHARRVRRLRQQQKQRQAVNKLCADANRLAGTDGANFFTKAGKVLKEKTHAGL